MIMLTPIKDKKPKSKKQVQQNILAKGANQKTKNPASSKQPVQRIGKNLIRSNYDKLTQFEADKAKRISDLVLSITIPKEVPPCRLGSVYGTYETACANPYALCNPYWSANNATGFLFRDPYRFFICPFNIGSNVASVYRYDYLNFPMTGAQQQVPGYPLQYVSGPAPHGPTLYPGRMPGQVRSWYWMTFGRFEMSNPTSQTMRCYIYADHGNVGPAGDMETVIDVAAGGLLSYSVLEAGYFAVDLSFGGNVSYSGYLQLTEINTVGPLSTYAHKAIPDMKSNQSKALGIKLYGASLLYSNQASPLNRQGKLAACQIPAGTDWRAYTVYDKISELKEAYTSTAVNGYYGYLKSTSSKDYEFKNQFVSTQAGVQQAWWDKSCSSDWLALAVQVTDPGGQDAVFTYSAALEYRTNDQWAVVKKPVADDDDVLKALELVSKAPQHFENPIHLNDIWEWVKNATYTVVKGISDVLPFALKVGTAAAPILAAMV